MCTKTYPEYSVHLAEDKIRECYLKLTKLIAIEETDLLTLETQISTVTNQAVIDALVAQQTVLTDKLAVPDGPLQFEWMNAYIILNAAAGDVPEDAPEGTHPIVFTDGILPIDYLRSLYNTANDNYNNAVLQRDANLALASTPGYSDTYFNNMIMDLTNEIAAAPTQTMKDALIASLNAVTIEKAKYDAAVAASAADNTLVTSTHALSTWYNTILNLAIIVADIQKNIVDTSAELTAITNAIVALQGSLYSAYNKVYNDEQAVTAVVSGCLKDSIAQIETLINALSMRLQCCNRPRC